MDVSHLERQYDSLTTISQQVLLANVQKQIKKGGPEAAVAFCSEKALPITDSLSESYGIGLSRISDRNRNPQNAPKTEADREMLAAYRQGIKGDTLLRKENNLTYYKPIYTALPACLQCHGKPNADIKPPTLSLILEKYPNDKATGYALNDFRGLWKIEKKLLHK